ncbi:hypothetical protein ANO11243_071770 [Dothideomycetidae sp. 11243]|nr:hypothetical protein ANO11243_071770 [fungal sp. No.11243]
MKSITFPLCLLAWSTSALVHAASGECSAKVQHHINLIEGQVKNAPDFCNYYLSSTRTLSPLKGINQSNLSAACVCIMDEASMRIPMPHDAPDLGSSKHASQTCKKQFKNALASEYKKPHSLCKFFEKNAMIISPVPEMTPQQILQGCNCIIPPTSAAPAESATSSHKHKHKPATTSMPPFPFATSCPTANQTLSVNNINEYATQAGNYSTFWAEYRMFPINTITPLASTYYTSLTLPWTVDVEDVASSCGQEAILVSPPMENRNGRVDMGVYLLNDTTPPYWKCIVFEADHAKPANATDLLCGYTYVIIDDDIN